MMLRRALLASVITLSVGMTAAALSGCSRVPTAATPASAASALLVGRWLQSVPGMPGVEQGFELRPDGSAQSLNMATLRYEGWRTDGRTLTLSGMSIGNRQTIPFEERLEIRTLSDTDLTVRDGERELHWHRAP